MKKYLIGLAVVIIFGIGYYALSPLFKNKTSNDVSPLAENSQINEVPTSPVTQTATGSLSSADQIKLDAAMDSMKDKQVNMAETMPTKAAVLKQGEVFFVYPNRDKRQISNLNDFFKT